MQITQTDFMYTYVCIHLYTYIHTHTHTYIYIYIYMSRRLKGAFCVFGDFYKSAKASPGLSPPPVAAFGAAAL